MFSTVIMLLTLFGVAFASAGALFVSLRNAPEGYEDHTGFNYVLWRNDPPETPNVACVWSGDFTWKWLPSVDPVPASA
jgi:hypothetical protein